MTSIADKLREVRAAAQLSAEKHAMEPRLANAILDLPDPDAVGECLRLLSEMVVYTGTEHIDRARAALAKLEEKPPDYSDDKVRDRYLAEGGDPH